MCKAGIEVFFSELARETGIEVFSQSWCVRLMQQYFSQSWYSSAFDNDLIFCVFVVCLIVEG